MPVFSSSACQSTQQIAATLNQNVKLSPIGWWVSLLKFHPIVLHSIVRFSVEAVLKQKYGKQKMRKLLLCQLVLYLKTFWQDRDQNPFNRWRQKKNDWSKILGRPLKTKSSVLFFVIFPNFLSTLESWRQGNSKEPQTLNKIRNIS